MATYGYIQPVTYFPDAKNGHLSVFIAGGTTLAMIYSPVSGDPISNPLSIDSTGYGDGFVVDIANTYDLLIEDFGGANKLSRKNIVVIGSSTGEPGVDGTNVYLTVNPDGSAYIYDSLGHSTTITNGTDGTNGTNGIDGTNGTNGTNGINGVSLVSIYVDETTNTGKVLYNLSSDPDTFFDAGDILPSGIGQVRVNSEDTMGYLNTKVIAGAGISIVGSTELTVTLDPTVTSDIATLKDDVIDLDARVDVLESASVSKQVLYGGGVGDTNVVIPHTMATSNLSVTCYNTIDNTVIFLGVTVSDTQVSIGGLSPLSATNQIKIVLIR